MIGSRPSAGRWPLLYLLLAVSPLAAQAQRVAVFGPTDGLPVPGDYDGDGRAELAVFDPGHARWVVQRATGLADTLLLGSPGGILVPGDYDGDGRIDPAVFQPSSGEWTVLGSRDGISRIALGTSGDLPVPGDYDGDGRIEPALYRPSTGQWFVSGGSVPFGNNRDLPVPGDYDGDGRTDIAVFRSDSGEWFILGSTAGFSSTTFGNSLDLPLPGDYDGDGRTDLGLYRRTTARFCLRLSSEGGRGFGLGVPGALTVTDDFDGDGRTDLAVFRPSEAEWTILELTPLVGVVADATVQTPAEALSVFGETGVRIGFTGAGATGAVRVRRFVGAPAAPGLPDESVVGPHFLIEAIDCFTFTGAEVRFRLDRLAADGLADPSDPALHLWKRPHPGTGVPVSVPTTVSGGELVATVTGFSEFYFSRFTSVGVPTPPAATPTSLRLLPASPNPFNPTTTIGYELPVAGDIRLDVFDALGRRVRTLVAAVQSAGLHTATFDAADLPSGLYVSRLTIVSPSGRQWSVYRTMALVR